MRVEQLSEFREFLEGALAFWGQHVSEFTLTVWWQAMQPFDLDAVKDAIGRHAMNPESGGFAPKPSDVVRMLQGSTQDTALHAWAKVDKAVRQVGTYADVVFDDPIIHRVLHDMGGWIGLGQKTEDEWPFVAREFENRYRGYRMRSEVPEYPPVLLGIAGAHNRKGGHDVQPPMLVGNAEACRLVIMGGTEKPLIGFTQANATAELLRLVDDSGQSAA